MKAKIRQLLGCYPISVFRAIKAGNGTSRTLEDVALDKANGHVKSICHRGHTLTAPENTLEAFIEAKLHGYEYVEADVTFTSDGTPVIIHDATIDRTSDGSGAVADMTYDELRQYDFGEWYSDKYIGTTIPSFDEFIALCKNIGLKPYIDLRGTMTVVDVKELVTTVKRHGMQKHATWISFNIDYLSAVKDADNKARLGRLTDNENGIIEAVTLLTGSNEVFVDADYTKVTDAWIDKCIANNVELELYTVNSKRAIQQLNSYVTGVTSDTYKAGRVLYEANIRR